MPRQPEKEPARKIRDATIALAVWCCSAWPGLAKAAEQWEYFIAASVEDLNRPTKDPTDDCRESTALKVLGRVGWELVTIYADSRRETGLATGTIVLQPERANALRQGKLQLSVQSAERMTAVLKRPLSHPLRGQACG